MRGSRQLADGVAGAAEGDAEGDGFAEGEAAAEGEAFGEGDAAGDGLADGLVAAVTGRQIRVSCPYFAKTESVITDGWLGPSRSAAFCGPILAMSGTWQVMQRSTTNCPLTCTLGKSCWT